MKFIFFDVDRTLLCRDQQEPYIIDSTRDALNKLKELGHFVAIATGRNFALAKEYLDEFGLENMVVDGGNGFVIGKRLVEAESMDAALCRQLLQECDQNKISYAIVTDNSNHEYAMDQRFLMDPTEIFWDTIYLEKIDYQRMNSFFEIHLYCNKQQEACLPTLQKMTSTRVSDQRLHVETTEKSKGIKKVVEYFHGNLQDVVVFGDGTNDLDMFSYPWLKIAMGNAVDEIKERADYVTTDCNKDGIYLACQHFNWFMD